MKNYSTLLPLLLALALTACGQKEEPGQPAQAPSAETGQAMAPSFIPPGEDGELVDAATLYAASCAKCHGEVGEGLDGNPKLSGQKFAYLAGKLRDYRAGKVMGAKTVMMAVEAKKLSDTQIDALALFISE